MIEFLTYDVKVALLLAVFYMFYRLLLAKETFHSVNRVVLLATALLSFVLPLCVLTMHETVVVEEPMVVAGEMLEIGPVETDGIETGAPWWQTVVPALFLAGVAAVLGHTLMSMVRITNLIRKSEKHPLEGGITVCVTGNDRLTPFSWMNYIVMNRSDYEIQDAAILAHERGHIRLRHSLDLLLVDTITAVQWFNPAVWMLRADLRAIHEYEADAAVLSQGINARQYQYLLITKAAGIGGYSLANGISHSTLKNRIRMMTTHKSTKASYLRLLALLPIVGAALALNAKTDVELIYKDAPETPVAEPAAQAAEEVPAPTAQAVATESVQKAAADTAKTVTVNGFVYDSDHGKSSPIVGATVVISGTKKGSVTDLGGHFSVKAKSTDKLVVGYVGYTSCVLDLSKMLNTGSTVTIALEKENVYDVVDEMPNFPGGQAEMMAYLASSLRYPKEAHEAGVQGRVIARFIVEEDGTVSNARVLSSSKNEQLDEEALRVIRAMPKWTPGKVAGKAVRVKYAIPVMFSLQGSSSAVKAKSEVSVSTINDVVVVGYKQNQIGLNPEETELEVDGELMPMDQLEQIKPDKIKEIRITKASASNPKNRIVVTTAKNGK